MISGNKYSRHMNLTCSQPPCYNEYDPEIDPSAMVDYSHGASRVFHQIAPGHINFNKNGLLIRLVDEQSTNNLF